MGRCRVSAGGREYKKLKAHVNKFEKQNWRGSESKLL